MTELQNKTTPILDSSIKKIKIKKKIPNMKSFRLFDFQTYDHYPSLFSESDENSDLSKSSNASSLHSSTKNKTRRNKEDPPPEKKQPNFRIEMFGVNEKGETVAIFADNMLPFFFVKVGEDWTDAHLHDFLRFLRKKLKQDSNGLLYGQLVDYNKLYGFSSGKKFRFIELVFQNMQIFNKVRNFWYKTSNLNETYSRKLQPLVFYDIELELYESKIPPLLRYFHIQKISPTGWVHILMDQVVVPTTRTTTCTYEYICNMEHILPIPEKETLVPFKICSFDIEASSSHGDFPVPIKNYKRLATQMVDMFLLRMGYKEIIDEKTAKQLFSMILKKAFRLSKIELTSIDVVYPKTPPNKEYILECIEELFLKPVELVKQQESEGKKILTISSMFEKIAEEAKIVMKTTDSKEDDEDNEDSDNEEPKSCTFSAFPPKKIVYKAEKTATIIDVLLEPHIYSREAKIQLVNQALTCILPPLEGDKTTFIGSTFLKYGEAVPYRNHCLVVGSCDPVEGTEIVSVASERELLIEWANIIQEEDPDIIIGYNIFGFDYEFMFRRAQETHCRTEFLKLSRKMSDTCIKKTKEGEYSLEQTKTKLASGEYDLRYPNISGRLQIDLLYYFRRDFNFSSYKLDDVAGSIISDKIKKIVPHETSDGIVSYLYTENTTGLNKGDYIHIEMVGFTSDYFQDGKKFHVLNIQEKMDENNENKQKWIVISGHYPELELQSQIVLKWCISKDDVSPQDIFRFTNGTSKDRSVVAKYCIQDCNLVQHLMKKTDVLTGYIEMARICNVPMRFLVFRGQGIKLTSYVAKTCREKQTLMPDLEHIENDDGYEGAIVLPPKCAMYMDNPVFCNDYSSLYPSIAKAWNLSPNSKVWTKDYDLEGNLVAQTGEIDPITKEFIYDHLPDYQYVDTEFDLYQTTQTPPTKLGGKMGKKIKSKIGKRICRWAQFPNGEEGIIPSIIGNLLKARSDTRIMAENETDPFVANILDKRQLGYKVTANSLYGQMGSSVSTFFEKDVAASITAIGRMMIMYAKTMIEQIYGDSFYDTKNHGRVRTRASYVYGDTDSVFFTFNLEDTETGEAIRGKKALEITIEIAQESAKICSLYLPPPMKLAYEKTLMSFILLSKKRYVGMLYETNSNKGKLKFMGLSLKRRDACDYLKDVYGGILTILMNEPNNIKSAIDFLMNALNQLIHGNVSMDKLAITKSLRSEYKNPKQIAHNVLAERIGEREPGNKPKPGDRIKYVYFVNTDKKALQGERIETLGYILSKKLKIDYNHYITNQLMKPLQQLFGLALEKIYVYLEKPKEKIFYYQEIQRLEQLVGDDVENFMKQREKYCSAKVKEYLFNPFLMKIHNLQNGIQTIDSMFSKLPVRNKLKK
jgi:DNA polymerase elongation subunit (family B)